MALRRGPLLGVLDADPRDVASFRFIGRSFHIAIAADVADRKVFYAPLLILLNMGEFVRPKSRVVKCVVLFLKHDDVIKRDRIGLSVPYRVGL